MMSKRFLAMSGLILAVPLLAFALLRMRGESPAAPQQAAAKPDPDALPEAIADLQRRIDSGKSKLDYEESQGYLRSLLRTLDIPVSSQSLVFSKSSAQLFLISPETPRALYFNDDVYIGYVQGAPHLEVASVDPVTGPVFYTLDQVKADKPKFTLQPTDCLACHDTFESEKPVPRLLMLSVLSDPTGVALNRSSIVTNDKSPFLERWGGWYVTGNPGNQRHMGNHFVREPAESLGTIRDYSKRADLTSGSNVTDLTKRFDTKAYLTPDSDIVALMVLGHQTHVHNLITVTGTNLRANPAESALKDETERLFNAMLFVDAAPLTQPVTGTTKFAEEFSARGPRDSQGRSLHQLDLKTRLLRYPLSYLVYSKSFDALPEAAKNYIYQRFFEVLSGKDTSASFNHLSPADRKAILEILKETKPDFAAFVKQLG
jgi:hypothetical protein